VQRPEIEDPALDAGSSLDPKHVDALEHLEDPTQGRTLGGLSLLVGNGELTAFEFGAQVVLAELGSTGR